MCSFLTRVQLLTAVTKISFSAVINNYIFSYASLDVCLHVRRVSAHKMNWASAQQALLKYKMLG